MKECITHSFACECREEHFASREEMWGRELKSRKEECASLRRQVEILQKGLRKIEKGEDHPNRAKDWLLRAQEAR